MQSDRRPDSYGPTLNQALVLMWGHGESAALLSTKELDQRLERWANWARSPSMGAPIGVVGYLKERLDIAHDSDEMTDEIAVTERAVARAKLEEKAYWRVLARYYLGRLSIVEIALFFHTSEDGLKRLFLEAKGCVSKHIYESEQEGVE